MNQKQLFVALSADLYHRIEERVDGTEFQSVDEYVGFVMEEVLKEDEPEAAFSAEDEEEIKKRLRGLGYLD